MFGYRCKSLKQLSSLAIAIAVFCIALALSSGLNSAKPAAAMQTSIKLDDVIRMVKAGDMEDDIVAKIRAAKHPLELTNDERNALQQMGVSNTIIKYLLNPDLAPPAPPTPPAPPGAVAVPVPREPPPDPSGPFPDDPIVARLPRPPGVYFLKGTDILTVDIKSILPEPQGGGFFSKIVPGGGKVVGVLPGAAAQVQVGMTPALFYLRLAENMKVEDFVLVSLNAVTKSKRRELEFIASKEKGGKPTVKIDSIHPTERVAVGPRLFKVTTGKLGKGEFMFYLVGSADPGNSILGKGYDFGAK